MLWDILNKRAQIFTESWLCIMHVLLYRRLSKGRYQQELVVYTDTGEI